LNNLAGAQVKRNEKVNSETIQAFFTELRAENGSNKRIHLILDGAGYHRAKIVKEKADELNIKLHFLPPYSPNLNSIERLWKVMNEHVRNNKYFSTAKEFRDKIDEFFSQILPKIGDTLASRINYDFQVLNSASCGVMGIYFFDIKLNNDNIYISIVSNCNSFKANFTFHKKGNTRLRTAFRCRFLYSL
jgi:transposase